MTLAVVESMVVADVVVLGSGTDEGKKEKVMIVVSLSFKKFNYCYRCSLLHSNRRLYAKTLKK